MSSSVIARFSYEEKSKSLIVVFVAGLVYRYKDVPKKIYKEMKKADSKGIFFNTCIKGVYNFELINQ